MASGNFFRLLVRMKVEKASDVLSVTVKTVVTYGLPERVLGSLRGPRGAHCNLLPQKVV